MSEENTSNDILEEGVSAINEQWESLKSNTECCFQNIMGRFGVPFYPGDFCEIISILDDLNYNLYYINDEGVDSNIENMKDTLDLIHNRYNARLNPKLNLEYNPRLSILKAQSNLKTRSIKMSKVIVKNTPSKSTRVNYLKRNDVEKFLKSNSKSTEEEYVKMVVEYMTLTPKKKEYRKPFMGQYKLAAWYEGYRYLIVSINKVTNRVTMSNLIEPTLVKRVDFSEVVSYMEEYVG